MARHLFTYLFVLAVSVRLPAQPVNKTVLYTLTEKDGLTDNSVNCFFQDSRGIMWMGTSFGLNSFDGSVVRSFHTGSTRGNLPDDAVNDIKEDAKGNLWIATGGGIACYDPATHKLTPYQYEGAGQVLNRFYSLEIRNGSILLATENGLVNFNIISKQFTLIPHESSNPAASRITRIFTDSKKRTWLCSYDGVWLFDEMNHHFESYDNAANDALFDGLVNDIFEDHNGQLWFGTWSRGLKKLIPETKKIETFLHYSGSNTNVVSITEQKDVSGKPVLVAGSTLLKADFNTHSFQPFVFAGSTAPLFTNRVYTDRNNLLWISTSEGVKIYNPSRQYFQTVSLSGSVPITSQGASLLALQQHFLIGGEGNTALQLYSDSLNKIHNLSAQITGGPAVMNIQQDQQANFWLCTSNGLFLLNPQYQLKKIYQHSDIDPASLPKNFLNNLLLKKNGEVWVMPWRKGIWMLNKEGNFTCVLTRNGDSLLPAANVSKVLEDENGNCWITDYSGGLYKYSPASGKVEHITDAVRLSNEYIIGSQLWTVSSQAVISVNISNNRPTTYPLPPGKDKYEYDFIPDSAGHLWIATKTGLLSFNTRTGTFQQYSSADGLYTDVLDVSMASLSDGNILMAGNNFATRFSPAMALEENQLPPLLFTGANVDGNEKTIAGKTITLQWNEKNIRLSWALLNYSNPRGNIYYYKLDGVNKTWQNAGNSGEVNFNSLDPGTYQFHYKAATAKGETSKEDLITIIIRPPFWKTWWFKLLALTAVSTLFYAVVRYISQRNLKEKLLKLEKEQAIEKERNRISRDMHDELGSGLTKIAILTEVIKTQQQSNEHIEKISSTARNLVDSLDEMVWALNPQNDSLDKLAAYIAEYANQYMDGSGIECSISLPVEISARPVSEEKRRNIFMVVKEFLNNTIKHSHAKNVLLVLTENPGGFTLLLRDDGTGFDESATSVTGNGLKNMQQRIKDAGGISRLQSGPEGTELEIIFGR